MGHPSAGSLLEPSRELKQFDGNIDLDDLNQSEIPFKKRVAQFSNACLNRRCNGTIYFGVADGKKPEHRHGQIVGLPLDISHVEKFGIISHLQISFEGLLKHRDK